MALHVFVLLKNSSSTFSWYIESIYVAFERLKVFVLFQKTTQNLGQLCVVFTKNNTTSTEISCT